MPRDGKLTRQRLLDVATDLILERGFAGTTVDEVIARAKTTKGTFFYHFETKDALARAAIERFAEMDRDQLETALAAAEAASSDPLQQVLHLIRSFETYFAALQHPHPGCLFASYIYEARLFDADTLSVITRSTCLWRDRLGAKLREAARVHPPRADVDLDSLADAFTVVLEGAFILSKVEKRPAAIVAQLVHYRRYLELLFEGPTS